MLSIRIERKASSNFPFNKNLQPRDVLEQPNRSSFVPQDGDTEWKHKTYSGLIAWTRLADDSLECKITCDNPIDDWALWSALTGYLVRSPLRDHIATIELHAEK